MLDRLRPRPVVGGHDEQRGVDLAGSDEHVADEPVVTGHVDEVELGSVVEGQVGIADVDRHPAPALLGQAVGVDPGQRPQEARLAVVDVTGRPDDDGHRPGRSRSPPRAPGRRSSSRAGSTVRRSSTHVPRLDPADDRRPAVAQPPEEGRGPGHGDAPRRERLARQRTAPDGRLERQRVGPERRVVEPGHERLRPRPQVVGPCGDHPPDGDLADRQPGPVQPERRRQRRERRLVGPCRPGERIAPEPCDELGPSDDEAGLRPADQLVAAERHQVRAGGQPLARRRLVGEAERRRVEEGPAAEVVDHDRTMAMGELGERGRRRAPRRSPPGGSSRGGRGARAGHPSARAGSKSATRVRFVVPTSTSRAPARRTISGMRTPPPISTSSPRDTTTRPPRPASPTASATAAALLLTTSASSAPVSAIRCSSTAR